MSERPQITPELVAALCQAVPRRAAMVWVYLWSRTNLETGRAWPAVPTIASAVRTNRNHVFEDIDTLAATGWLRVERRAGACNRYEVLTPTSVGRNRDGTAGTGGSNRDGTNPYPVQDQTSNRGGTLTLQNTTKNTKRARKGGFDPMTVDLPYQSKRFQNAWHDFCEHRGEIKKPLTRLAVTKLLNTCKQLGEAVAIDSIDRSIENRWTGIFPPKGNGKSSGQTSGVPKTPPAIFHPNGSISYGSK